MVSSARVQNHAAGTGARATRGRYCRRGPQARDLGRRGGHGDRAMRPNRAVHGQVRCWWTRGQARAEALRLVVGAAAKTSSRRPFRSKKAPTRLKPEAPHANGFRRAAKRPNNVFEQPSAETSLAGASVAPTQQHRVLAKKRPRVAAADGGTRSAPARPRAESCTRQWTARRELGVSLQDSAGVNSPVHRRSDRDSDDNFCVY